MCRFANGPRSQQPSCPAKQPTVCRPPAEAAQTTNSHQPAYVVRAAHGFDTTDGGYRSLLPRLQEDKAAEAFGANQQTQPLFRVVPLECLPEFISVLYSVVIYGHNHVLRPQSG